MTIYSIVIVILICLFLIELRGGTQQSRRMLFFLSSFVVFVIMAFRGDDVGGDTIEYVHFWIGENDMYGTWKKPAVELENEPGLSWLCHILHFFNNGSPWFFIFSESLFVLIPFFYLIWRDSKYKVLPILLLMVMWGIFDVTITGLRQVLGCSFLIISFIIWTSKIKNIFFKKTLAIFSFVFALSFHPVTYFISVFYSLLFLIRNMKREWAVFLLVISYVITFASSFIISSFIPIIENYFSTTAALFRLVHYFSENTNESSGLYQFLGTLFVCIYVYYSDKQIKYNYFYTNCLCFGCILLNMFSFFPNIARFTEPLFFVGIISSPNYIKLKKRRLNYLFFTIVLIFSLFKVNFWEKEFSDKSSLSYTDGQFFPYKFIWD